MLAILRFSEINIRFSLLGQVLIYLGLESSWTRHALIIIDCSGNGALSSSRSYTGNLRLSWRREFSGLVAGYAITYPIRQIPSITFRKHVTSPIVHTWNVPFLQHIYVHVKGNGTIYAHEWLQKWHIFVNVTGNHFFCHSNGLQCIHETFQEGMCNFHCFNSLHAINNYLWVCPYAELIWPRCVEMASLKAQLLTVSLRARIVPTDEKGRFHYDLEGCHYPSRVI